MKTWIASLNRSKMVRSTRVLLGLLLVSGPSAVNAIAQSVGTFVITGNMITPRTGHTATLLRDGRVLITGGSHVDSLNKVTYLDSAELYDPSTGTFTSTGNMTTSRMWHTATLLSDGRVLIVGGLPEAMAYPSSAELYDPVTGSFTRSGDTPTKVLFGYNTSAILLSSGKVLITTHPIAQIYDPAMGLFTPAGPIKDWTGDPVALQDGRVLIPAYHDVSLYSVVGDSLQLVTSMPGDYAAGPSATLLANGKVLIAGGVPADYDTTTKEASLYDPGRGTLESTGLMLFSRDGHTATRLPDGHVLIVGGYDGDLYDTGVPSLWNAEQYDPATGSFSDAGTLNYIRQGHTATLLPDGRVLIAGGAEGPVAELYIPPLRAVSAASLSGPLAPDSFGSLFGSSLAATTETADPLSAPTILGGVSLLVTDSAGVAGMVPLLYVSPTQINFVVPAGTATGELSLEIVSGAARPSRTTAHVNNTAPGLFRYEDGAPIGYALRFEAGGRQTVLSLRNAIVLDDRPVYLVLYATGMRNRSSLANVRCSIGGIGVPVEYAGPEGSGIPSLDQVNIRLTAALKGLGVANLVLTVDGVPANSVAVNIE
jgi:uncharacterized protein (TIGR03437 family)